MTVPTTRSHQQRRQRLQQQQQLQRHTTVRQQKSYYYYYSTKVLLLLFLLSSSWIASCCAQSTGTGTGSTLESDTHQNHYGSNTSNDDDNNNNNCQRYCQKQIHILQTEVGYCNAVKMAIETRETTLKQQVNKLQQQLQQQQQQSVPTSSTQQQQQQQQQTDERQQQHQQQQKMIDTQSKRIQELEQQLHDREELYNHNRTTMQTSLSNALRQINDYEIKHDDIMEHNEYLQMRLEEAIENEQRIVELSNQLHEQKIQRTSLKETIIVLQQELVQTKERVDEIEQHNTQSLDHINQLSQDIINKDQYIIEVQQQLDITNQECYHHATQLQYKLDTDIQQLHIIIQNERHQQIQQQQIYDEQKMDWYDRIRTMEQLLHEEILKSQNLTTTIQLLQEQQQQQKLTSSSSSSSSRANSIHRQYIHQLQQINQQYQLRYIENQQTIQYLQNELYTLRYNIHSHNEIYRYRTIYDILYINIIYPIVSYLYNPIFNDIIKPYVIEPIRIMILPYYHTIMIYIDQYIPQIQQFMIDTITNLQVWYTTIVLHTNIAYNHIRDTTIVYGMYISTHFWIPFQISVHHYLQTTISIALQMTIFTGEIIQQNCNEIYDTIVLQSHIYIPKIQEHISNMISVIDNTRIELEQHIINVVNHRYGVLDETTCIQGFYHILLSISLLLLLLLCRRRRLRYIVEE